MAISNFTKGCLYALGLSVVWVVVNGGIHTVEDVQCTTGINPGVSTGVGVGYQRCIVVEETKVGTITVRTQTKKGDVRVTTGTGVSPLVIRN